MPPKVSRRLVIDADVARAAGGNDASHSTSKNCRDFLKSCLEICHRLVMTPEMQGEWNRHQSAFSRKWRLSMVARRKVCFMGSTFDADLRNRVSSINLPQRKIDAMLKDIHLVEAALCADRTVVSLDETVRSMFIAVSQKIDSLNKLVWVNPDCNHEHPLVWLVEGAPPHKYRMIGSR